MFNYFYAAFIISLGFLGTLKASPSIEIEGEEVAPLIPRNSFQDEKEKIYIVGNADSRGRVILQSWERYQSNHPSFKLDPELDILALNHLMELLRPDGALAQAKINNAILKDERWTGNLAALFHFSKVLYISNGDEYRKIRDEYKTSIEINLTGLSSDPAFEKIGKEKNYDENLLFEKQYFKNGYSCVKTYIHYLPDFMIDYALIDFTVNFFNTQGGTYSGTFLKENLSRFSPLLEIINNKSAIYKEGKSSANPIGFGEFVAGDTKARYKMRHDVLSIDGNVAFLGNGICELHQHFRQATVPKIILNDINPLFPLFSLYSSNLSEDSLSSYEVVGQSAAKMQYEDDSFSKIYAGYLLKYLSIEEIKIIFHDVSKALKGGGRFYVEELSDSSLIDADQKARQVFCELTFKPYYSSMKSIPYMAQVIDIAHQNNLKYVYGASSDWQKRSLLGDQLENGAVPVKNEKSSYSLVFEKG